MSLIWLDLRVKSERKLSTKKEQRKLFSESWLRKEQMRLGEGTPRRTGPRRESTGRGGVLCSALSCE